MPLPSLKIIIETALLSRNEPLSLKELSQLSNDQASRSELQAALSELQQDWSERGVELVEVASGWRFQTRTEMQVYLDRLSPQKPPKYSRAVLETLAIIAYHQPVTRGDIEQIRGVTVASQIMKTLESRNWIEVIGQRDTPGRPELFATTKQFLDDLKLRKLSELPPLQELNTLLEPSNE